MFRTAHVTTTSPQAKQIRYGEGEKCSELPRQRLAGVRVAASISQRTPGCAPVTIDVGMAAQGVFFHGMITGIYGQDCEMSFQGKYEILSTLGEGESKSYRARQISSGRPVILHHLRADRTATAQPDLANLVFEFLRTASKEASRNFLDMGDEEGRIFIVTADAPECLDLRKWLQAGIGVPAGNDGTPDDAKNVQLTHNFTTDALRQLARSAMGVPAPASPGPPSALKSGPAKETSSAEKAAPKAPPASIPSREYRPTVFATEGGETSLAGLPGAPPSAALKQALATEVTAEFPLERKGAGGAGTPKEAGNNPWPAAGKSERVPDIEATAVFSSTFPQAAMEADTVVPQTKGAEQLKALVAAGGPVPEKTVLSPSSSNMKDSEPMPAENPAPRKSSKGFEMVFQSDKPRLHPTLSAPPDPSVMELLGPPSQREDLQPASGVPGVPVDGPPAATPPGGPRKATGTMFDMPLSPTRTTGTTGSRAWQAPLELENGTGPRPAPISPGSYTRMIENVKSLAGPLAPEGPPSGSTSRAGGAAAPGTQVQMPSSYPPTSRDAPPPPRPSQYHPHDGDALPPPHKRNVWVPIVILGSLFIMTVALLVFFALK